MNVVLDKGVKTIKETFICASPDCEVVAEKTTHNQKYCSAECCRIETKKKLKADWHENKAIANGKKRTCLNCPTSLSRYNTTKYCSSCANRKKEQYNETINDMVSSVSWI